MIKPSVVQVECATVLAKWAMRFRRFAEDDRVRASAHDEIRRTVAHAKIVPASFHDWIESGSLDIGDSLD